MLVVHKAYDDNTAEIMDITDYSVRLYYEGALIALANNHNVMGLSVSNNKINYISAYNVTMFPSENEAIEYLRERGLSLRNKFDINGLYIILEKTNETIHVDYVIGYITEVEAVYLANKGYTPYIRSAQTFSKRDAFRVANVMTNRSKTGKHWSAIRLPVK